MAREKTNEELANECDSIADSMEKYGGKGCGEKLRKAAARLRKLDGLNAKLRVAEDALTNLQARLVSSVYDGNIDAHEALMITENAISEISKEGGAK